MPPISTKRTITAICSLTWSSMYQKYYFWLHHNLVFTKIIISEYTMFVSDRSIIVYYAPDYYHYCPLLDVRHGIDTIHDSQYFMYEQTFYHMIVSILCMSRRSIICVVIILLSSVIRLEVYIFSLILMILNSSFVSVLLLFSLVLLLVGDTSIVVFILTW